MRYRGVGPGRAGAGAAFAVILAAGLAGCGSGSAAGPAPGGASPSTASPSAASASPTTNASAVVAGNAANGQTLRLRPGQALQIVLGSQRQAGSTGWTFAPLRSGVLKPSGAAEVKRSTGGPGCGVPGAGCGTVTLTAIAGAPGTAVITARRSSCGEAMRCSPGQDGFRLTVVVTA